MPNRENPVDPKGVGDKNAPEITDQQTTAQTNANNGFVPRSATQIIATDETQPNRIVTVLETLDANGSTYPGRDEDMARTANKGVWDDAERRALANNTAWPMDAHYPDPRGGEAGDGSEAAPHKAAQYFPASAAADLSAPAPSVKIVPATETQTEA